LKLFLDSKTWRHGPPLRDGLSRSSLVEDPEGGVIIVGGKLLNGDASVAIYKLAHAGSTNTFVTKSFNLIRDKKSFYFIRRNHFVLPKKKRVVIILKSVNYSKLNLK
jgi:hypothetical protein